MTISTRPLAMVAAITLLLVPGATLAAEGSPAASAPTASGMPATHAPLEGIRWSLREFRNEDGGMAGAFDGAWITLKDGAVTGSTGCNDIAGSYALDGASLAFGGLTPTEASCLDGDLVAQEMSVVGRLPQVTGFAFEAAPGVDGRDLVLVDATRGEHLRFASIQGRSWIPVYGGAEPTPEGYMTVRFENGAVTGQGPCNTFGGRFVQDDAAVSIGPLEATRMSCPDLDLENELLSDLQLARAHAFQAGDLVLLDEQGAETRRFTEERTGY